MARYYRFGFILTLIEWNLGFVRIPDMIRMNLKKSDSVRQWVIFGKLRDICIPEFIKDLTPILNDTDRLLNELIHAYTTGTNTLLSKESR